MIILIMSTNICIKSNYYIQQVLKQLLEQRDDFTNHQIDHLNNLHPICTQKGKRLSQIWLSLCFYWWRRRESNPRPKIVPQEPLHAQSSHLISRNNRPDDMPVISPAFLNFHTGIKGNSRNYPVQSTFLPQCTGKPERNGSPLFRRPLHNYSLQLNFVSIFLRG